MRNSLSQFAIVAAPSTPIKLMTAIHTCTLELLAVVETDWSLPVVLLSETLPGVGWELRDGKAETATRTSAAMFPEGSSTVTDLR
jgi:hypothetical protein